MAGLLEGAGAQSKKPTAWGSLFVESLWEGLYTNRAVLHSSGSLYEQKYLGGRPGSLITGLNTEISVRNTLIRRPGISNFSEFTYPTPPSYTYSFPLTDGTIRVMVDTGSSGSLAITSCNNASGGTTVYNGTFPNGGSNAYLNYIFQVTGFATNLQNNGTFVCTASTTTTLTLQNAQGVAETIAAAAVTAGGVYWDEQNGSSILLFAKNPGAGQTGFVAVGGVLYMGDGVDTRKWTPLNTNTPPGSSVSVWGWGTAAPTNAPTITSQSSGGAAVSWQASTVWSTMGLIYDSTTGTIQQLNSVNGNPSSPNTTQFGETATGQPAWNQTPGGTTSDGALTWTNYGPIGLWSPHTLYQRGNVGGTAASPCIIYDPTTAACYYNANSSSAGTSGNSKPVFKAGSGQITQDGGIRWAYLSPGPIPAQWAPSTTYQTVGTADSVNTVSEPVSLANGYPSNQTVYWQVVTSGGGGSSGSGVEPNFSTVAGAVIGPDGNILWMSLGSATWAAHTNYVQWYASGSAFSCINDGTNFQVCTTSGESGGSTPSWNTGYGNTTTDGTVVWTCVGPKMVWAASTNWYLPAAGFFPPVGSGSYGGASVQDSNGNIEFCIASGLGGSTAPTWKTFSGGTATQSNTTDHNATWYNLEPATTQSLVYTKGFAYAYSFKSLALNDFYAALPDGGGNIPPGITSSESGGINNFAWTGVPTGSETNLVSTASPAFTLNGASPGAIITVSGYGSLDPQIDTIVIWRSNDGGGSGQMFELTEIPAPKPVGGVAQPWSFRDFLPSLPTATFPGLNTLIPAPIDEVNDPPESSAIPQDYNFQRIWVADGTAVPFSGGPDTLVGNPNECFAPADNLPFLAPVKRMIKIPAGNLVFTTSSIELIAGGPATSTFYSVTIGPGIGLGNFNAADIFAGEIFFLDTSGQLRIVSPTLSVTSAGFAIADQLKLFSPSTAYVTYADLPNDAAVYIGTGSTTYNGNTGWFRMNPRQIPGGINGPEPVWSPFAAITGGCQMVQALEVSPGIRQLLVGPSGAGTISKRDFTVYTDNGSEYDANATLGSLFLAHRGELAILKFIECDFAEVTTNPTVSFLLNEISGSFTNFTTSSAPYDPPSLYGGRTSSPSSYNPIRFYFGSTTKVARCVHGQFGIDFGTTSNADECFNLTINGAIVKNK